MIRQLHGVRLRIEPLENRRVLSASPLITEFMAANDTTIVDGDGVSSDWIEIHNPATTDIDLSNWHLTDNDADLQKWSFPATTLTAGEYLVVFASGQAVDNYVDPLGYLHTNFKLGSGGEYLGLTDAIGNIIHDFAPAYPAQSTDISYGIDLVDDAVYFAVPTPGAINDFASTISSQVQITEIMYHPASDLETEEYIEIHNGEPTALNLTDWSIDSGIRFTFPNVSVPADGYLVVAADVAAFAAKYPSVTNVVGGWEGRLSNSSDTIQLFDAAGLFVDGVTYADQGQWAVREVGPLDFGHEGWVWSDAHDGNGRSLEVVNLALPNSLGQNWSASSTVEGTPGVVNSTSDADNDTAPLIVDVQHSPSVPSSSDPVVITTTLLDESNAVASATVMWRVDGATTFTATTLSDNGTGPDVTAGDGRYSGSIPAHSDGTVVEWFISVFDTGTNGRTFPAASQPTGQQLTNLLYQVDDNFNPNPTIGIDLAAEYRLIMTESERAELQQIGSNATEGNSHAQMNGTFISVSPDGIDVRYNVGIRNRGRGSRDALPNSYRVNLPTDARWQGIDQFNLNTQYTHLQMIGMRMFAASGLMAEDVRPVLVQVNGMDLSNAGSPSYGVYMQVEVHNSHFAANHFPEDSNGNLYRVSREGSGLGGYLQDLGPDLAPYLEFYEKETNEGQADYSDLLNLIDIISSVSDDDYFTQINKVIDVDQWLGYFAGVALLGSEETMLGTGIGDDYLLYSGTNDPRFRLISHDFDTILGQGDTPGNPLGSIHRATGTPTIERFLTHPQIAPLYHGLLLELLETTFSKPTFDSLIDDWVGQFASQAIVSDLIDFMDQRRDFVTAEVTKSMTADAGLALVGGYQRTTQDVVGLFGTAPLANTHSVTVNRQLAELDPFTGEWTFGETLGGATETLVDTGHVWSYLDAGQVASTTTGDDWRIDDPGWVDTGISPLGYGGNGEATTVAFIDTDPVAAGTQKNITTYYRSVFNVAAADEFSSLTLDVRRDDGAIIYLNGSEVARSNMPSGSISDTTRAATVVGGSDENTFFNLSIDPSLLVEGENVLAVEIHQVSDSSSDTIFDLKVAGTRGDSTTLTGLPLTPGINRVLVAAYDDLNGIGNVLDSTYIDIWYDDGDTIPVGGIITSDTTWTAAAGPYVVTSDLAVSGGVLTIEPGTTLFFNSGVGFTLNGTGQVIAEGAELDRIRFSHNPALGTSKWEGVTIANNQSDNRFRHIDFSSGDAQGNALFVDHGRAVFDYAAWFDIDNQVIDLVHPTLVVSHSSIPGISGDETIHLVGLDVGEQLEFNSNIIGKNTSGGDVVDMAPDSLSRQTIYFRDNVFLGGYDDGVDTDGTITVFENNTFIDFHYNTTRTTTSNAISSGYQNVGATTLSSELTIIGNKFYDVDHAVLLKDFGYANIVNNTIVKATVGGIQFQELNGSNVIGPGQGADLDGNIFWETPLIFEAIHPSTVYTLNRSIVTADLVEMGVGNLAVDPLLVDPARGDFRLLEDSAAFYVGPMGTDIGAVQFPRYVAGDLSNLRLTEVHYNPLAGSHTGPLCEILADGDLFEFVELYNPTNDMLDLSNVRFTDGIDFSFSWGTFMEPGEVLVLVKNQDIFESRYGWDINVRGEYRGKLSNSGEAMELMAADGSIIQQFAYGDGNVIGWPANPDGHGASLQIVDVNGDYDDPANWTDGADPGGTPGYFANATGDFNGDGQLDCVDIDALQAEVVAGSNGLEFDMNADGIVDQFDRDAWLALAGSLHLASGRSYAAGDANLDGFVNGIDFVIWNANKFSTNSDWCGGDFNADGFVNGVDFVIWNANKFTSQDVAPLMTGNPTNNLPADRPIGLATPMEPTNTVLAIQRPSPTVKYESFVKRMNHQQGPERATVSAADNFSRRHDEFFATLGDDE